MKEKERKDFAKHYIETAEKRLEAARLLLESNYFDDAINRIYYAMLYTIKALLLMTQYRERDDEDEDLIRDLFFSRLETFPKLRKYAKTFDQLHFQRKLIDLTAMSFIDYNDVEDVLEQTEEFISEIREIFNL